MQRFAHRETHPNRIDPQAKAAAVNSNTASIPSPMWLILNGGKSPIPGKNAFYISRHVPQVVLLAACALIACVVLAQSTGSSDASQTTEARLKAPGWWPTKGDRSRDEYVGAAVCATCHAAESKTFQASAMARAATRAVDSDSLREHDHLTFQVGPYNYQISHLGAKDVLRISDGGASYSAALLWAFGMGRMAQTYVYEKNDSFYEAHLSYYTALGALDVTPGHPRTQPPSLVEGAGRPVPTDEIRRCFGCHTTASTVGNRFDPQAAVLGVTCEVCHGPGAAHVAAIKSGKFNVAAASIVNPAQMTPAKSVDFCGSCHRTWQDVVSDSPTRHGGLNVRFAPYRLQNSRCWKDGKEGARITCITCHNPHQPLVEDPASYDSACLQCHLAAGGNAKNSDDDHRTACPVGVKLCVTCHMPKSRNPAFHFAFTDHWIRIAAPEAPLPD